MQDLFKILYFILTLLTIFFPISIQKYISYRTLYFIVGFLTSLAFRSLINSNNGTELGDISVYVMNMQLESLFGYHFKEPIFWFSMKYLYDLTQNPAFVFMIFDFIIFFLILKSFESIKAIFFENIKYHDFYFVIFLFLTSFLFFYGFHNIYRQLLAGLIFLYLIQFISIKKRLRALAFYVVMVLIHNPSFMLTPILLILEKNKFIRLLMFSCGLIILFIARIILDYITSFGIILSDGASGSEIGMNISLYLLFAYSLLTILILCLEGILKNPKKFLTYLMALTMAMLIVAFYLTPSSLSFYRVFHYVLLISFPFIAFYFIDRVKPEFMTKSLMLILSTSFTFLLL